MPLCTYLVWLKSKKQTIRITDEIVEREQQLLLVEMQSSTDAAEDNLAVSYTGKHTIKCSNCAPMYLSN